MKKITFLSCIQLSVIRLLVGTCLLVQTIVPISAHAEQLEPQNSAAGFSAPVGDCSVFPANNFWNTPVDNLPVHTRSDQWVNTIGRNTGFHMDFGTVWDGGPIGIPYNVVGSGVPKVSVNFEYSDESDPGPYPIPTNPLIEYGSDHHILMVDNSTCTLYELFDASYSGGQWYAGSGAIWSLNSNTLRPDTWTSADAAGLPILPGLVRYEEVVSGEINHAIRFTAANTNGYIWPARHLTSNNPSAPQIPPMGARFRLNADYDISGYPAALQVILRAMKTYGIVLADNGSNWYVSGAPDSRWNDGMLHLLDDLTGDDFEAVDTSSLMIDYDSGATSTEVNNNPNPPDEPVKLIFIHHSTGQNWLTDGYGNLGQTLGQNNYFVSDTNYGWGPNAIGDRTDIPHWIEWFASGSTPTYMSALFNESGQHSTYTRTLSNPGGENEIIMFKSCFPNSALTGNPNDPPNPSGWLTVGHAKYVYNTILQYFATRPDKMFVVITAPPLQNGTYAANARAFNQWLMNDWLDNYTLNNVFVFDFYNVLTGPEAHHRYNNGQVEHILGNQNTLYYDSDGDDHPSVAGSQKATDEFVPLLNVFYHRWKAASVVDTVAPAAISGMTAATGTIGATVNLNWVAPGDDGSTGTAASYLVRYSSSAIIDEATWSAATPVPSGIPTPLVAGSAQSMTVSGLVPGQTYYFAVRAQDEQNNLGGISNSPGAAASSAPAASAGTHDDGNTTVWNYFGSWTIYNGDGPYHSTLHQSNTIGSYGEVRFNGVQVKLMYLKAPGRGSIDVYIDGTKVTTLNASSPSVAWQQIWTSGTLTDTVHTVRFQHAGGGWIDLDAIQIITPDTTAPAVITSLTAATGSGTGMVNLSWTAVGDDGNSAGGAATTYLVRYSTSAILTQTDWNNATVVNTGVPAPKMQGQAETMTVSGLTAGQTYYFGVRAQDEQSNLGGLSNSPGAAAGSGSATEAGIYDDGNLTVWRYSGTWTTYNGSGPYGSTLHQSNTTGSYGEVTFRGTQVKLTYLKAPGRGSIDVYIDGTKITTLNASSPSVAWQQTWTSGTLTDTVHTVRFQNASGGWIDLDAVQIQ